MKIVAVQLDTLWEEPAKNFAKVMRLLEETTPGQNALVILPEMFASGFSMDAKKAIGQEAQIIEFMRQCARNFGVYLIGGMAATGMTGKAENRATVINPDGTIITSYTKLHPFAVGGERDHYAAGSEIVTFDLPPFTVSPLICYDLRFPEIFRIAALRRRVNLFAVIANWPISRVEHWITLLRARAIENQSWVLGCNRSGRDPNTLYGGRSMLIDPMGVIRADAGEQEGLLIADADFQEVARVRERLPFLSDARDQFLASAH